MGTFDAAGFAKALENDAVKLAAEGQDPRTPFADGKYTADDPKAPLSCPFCGGKADLDHDYPGRSYSPYWRVGCQDCGFYLDHGDTQAEAIATWNRRA
jgi:Lar family restriction alleviation protein